jgi:deoxyribodipyrimidine photolyase
VDQRDRKISWQKNSLRATNQELAQSRANVVCLKDDKTSKSNEILGLKLQLEDYKIALSIYENAEIAADEREKRLAAKTVQNLAEMEKNLGKISSALRS